MLVNGVLTRTVKIITWTLPRKIQRNQHRAQKEYEFYEEDLGSTVRTTYFSKEAYDQSVEWKLDRYLNRYGWIVKKLIRSSDCVYTIYTLRPN